jgi:hypothetical protein
MISDNNAYCKVGHNKNEWNVESNALNYVIKTLFV